jgi:hypothetical protein
MQAMQRWLVALMAASVGCKRWRLLLQGAPFKNYAMRMAPDVPDGVGLLMLYCTCW